MPLRDVLRDFPLTPHRLIAASNHEPDGDALNSLVVDCRGNAQVLFPQSEMPQALVPGHLITQLGECRIQPLKLQWKVINLTIVFGTALFDRTPFNRPE